MLFPTTFALALLAIHVHAKDEVPSGGAGAGHYKVVVASKTYESAGGKNVRAKDLPATGIVTVSGIHTSFMINTANLGVYNYTLTGFPDTSRTYPRLFQSLNLSIFKLTPQVHSYPFI